MSSEIARFRAQQARSEEAAKEGLSGYAVTSQHAFIEKRMEQGAVQIQALMDAGHYGEALALMETDGWQGVLPQVATSLQALPEGQKEGCSR